MIMAWEGWRIRSAIKSAQIRIVDVLFLTTLVALIAGAVVSESRTRSLSKLIAQTPVGSNSRYAGDSYGRIQDSPAWLLRLIGLGRCEKFLKIRFLSLTEPVLRKLDTQVLDEIAEQVHAYGRIRCIDVLQTGPCTKRFMGQIGPVDIVRVWPAHADRAHWRKIAKANNWSKLTFENEP